MRLLNGRELAEFIKERQAKEVRRLKQAEGKQPKLVIIQTKDDPVINTYVRLKKEYGADIGIDVEVLHPAAMDSVNVIDGLNSNPSVHGMIVQLPLDQPAHTERVLNAVAPHKDVDGLAKESNFIPATPTAILWLLGGYNVELKNKQIAVIGQGPLVGAPLILSLQKSGHTPIVISRDTENPDELKKQADIVISATGSPGLVTSAKLKHKAVAIDAGTAVANGKTVGDLADDVYERDDITVTPKRGGVGPLTVCALFENVLEATRASSR